VGESLTGRPSVKATILHEIVSETRAEVAERRAKVPQAKVERQAQAAPALRDFKAALQRPELAVIAEMKSRSPSAGQLAAGAYRPSAIAETYAKAGAAALSVLTQGSRFGGAPEHLALARQAVRIPVLRKDFVTDPYQVFEARAYGADAVLLIVAAVEEAQLRELLALVRDLGRRRHHRDQPPQPEDADGGHRADRPPPPAGAVGDRPGVGERDPRRGRRAPDAGGRGGRGAGRRGADAERGSADLDSRDDSVGKRMNAHPHPALPHGGEGDLKRGVGRVKSQE